MKILSLDLLAFGPFDRRSLDLSADGRRLHIIFGRNEAGKSTTLRALTGWLFGIPETTSDAHVHPMNQLRVGGRLRSIDGRELAFVRRKGRTKTLRTPDTDEPIDDAVLQAFMPGLDEGLFKSLYGIDHTALVLGGQDILEQKGELGQALYSAALGTSRLRGLLEELDRSAESLFKAGGKTPVINAAIKAFKEAQQEVKQRLLKPTEWHELQTDIGRIEQQVADGETRHAQALAELNRLERVARVLNPLGQLRGVESELAALGEIMSLPNDFAERLRDAQGQLRHGELRLKELDIARQAIQQQRSEMIVDERLLSEKPRLDVLIEELGAYRKALLDLPRQQTKLEEKQKQVHEGLAAFRTGMDREAAEALLPHLARKTAIQELIARHHKLEAAREGLPGKIRQCDERLNRRRAELDVLPESLDLEPLTAAVGAGRSKGDLDERIRDIEGRISTGQARGEEELLRLGRWTGDLAAFMRLTLPLRPTVEGFEQRFQQMQERQRDLKKRMAEQRALDERCRNELDQLRAGKSVPTREDLDTARSRRDAGWRLVLKTWRAGDDPETVVASHDPDRPLTRAYEADIQKADGVADAIIADVQRVEHQQALAAEMERVAQRLERLAILPRLVATHHDQTGDGDDPGVRILVQAPLLVLLEDHHAHLGQDVVGLVLHAVVDEQSVQGRLDLVDRLFQFVHGHESARARLKKMGRGGYPLRSRRYKIWGWRPRTDNTRSAGSITPCCNRRSVRRR